MGLYPQTHTLKILPCRRESCRPDTNCQPRGGLGKEKWLLRILKWTACMRVELSKIFPLAVHCTHGAFVDIQGYLSHKKPHPPRTLREDSAYGPTAVLGGLRFLMSEVPLQSSPASPLPGADTPSSWQCLRGPD